MTLVDCKLYIIGGSYGQDYLKDVYILDTDPCPEFTKENEPLEIHPRERLFTGMQKMVNQRQFSDITFIVEGRPFYGHKVIISQLSEKLVAMFGHGSSALEAQGFKESSQNEIVIQNVSYLVFEAIMSYLYSGHFDLSSIVSKELKNFQAS